MTVLFVIIITCAYTLSFLEYLRMSEKKNRVGLQRGLRTQY